MGLTLVWTSSPATSKIRKDTTFLRWLLKAKNVAWEEVDIARDWDARQSFRQGDIQALPQVQLDGVFIGTLETLQDLEDHGELDELISSH